MHTGFYPAGQLIESTFYTHTLISADGKECHSQYNLNCCRPKDFGKAKYELVTSLRTHLGCQDDAFGCMGVAEDAAGVKGVFLRKNVIEVAGRALKTNITALAPRVLPWSQLVRLKTLHFFPKPFRYGSACKCSK